jgi:hypothetical protein
MSNSLWSEFVTDLGDDLAHAVKEELLTGWNASAVLSGVRQSRIAEANARLKHCAIEGVGQHTMSVDADVWHSWNAAEEWLLARQVLPRLVCQEASRNHRSLHPSQNHSRLPALRNYRHLSMIESPDREKISEILSDIDQADADGSQYVQRKLRNWNTRYCVWPGQSEDGRKHAGAMGRQPWPWDGAADTRVRLADNIIRDHCAILTNAFFKSRVQIQPVESMDIDKRTAAEAVLKWLLFQHCLDDLRREVRLAAEFRETYGLAIMAVDWQQTTRTEIKRFTIEEAQMMVQESQDPNLAALLEIVMDPLQEETAAELLGQVVPELGKVSKVRALRDKGEVEWESPYIFESKPVWTALEAWEDVIFPIQTFSLQRAAFVARRELLNEVELRERAAVEGWDEDWVEEAVKHKGQLKRIHLNLHRTDQFLFEQLRDLIEIWHVFRKENDPKTDAIRVTRSVISYHIPDKAAVHELLPYAHGMYPFVEMPRERSTRPLLESRGIPELVQTAQEEIKIQRDYRADRASISILPPVRVPANRGKFDLVLGPGVQVPERRPGEIGWMDPPRPDAGSIEVENATRFDVNNYFGRMADGVPPQMSMIHTQEMIDSYLLDMKLCVIQTMALAQQYMTPEEVSRVTGNASLAFSASPQDIRGRFDITAEFDARLLDSEALGAKLKYLSEILVPMDSFGVIDRAGLVKYMFQAVDPNMASMLVQDIGAATQQEIEDEQGAFAKIAAGTEPPMKEGGQNAQVRLQTLQQIIQSNPAVSQRYQQDEIFRRMLDARMQAFQFQLQQSQNAVIGRVGAQPALQQMAQEQQLGGPQAAA